jgi:hypothetical protein
VKLVDKRAADKAAHVARDRASRAREDAKVGDDDGVNETDSGDIILSASGAIESEAVE